MAKGPEISRGAAPRAVNGKSNTYEESGKPKPGVAPRPISEAKKSKTELFRNLTKNLQTAGIIIMMSFGVPTERIKEREAKITKFEEPAGRKLSAEEAAQLESLKSRSTRLQELLKDTKKNFPITNPETYTQFALCSFTGEWYNQVDTKSSLERVLGYLQKKSTIPVEIDSVLKDLVSFTREIHSKRLGIIERGFVSKPADNSEEMLRRSIAELSDKNKNLGKCSNFFPLIYSKVFQTDADKNFIAQISERYMKGLANMLMEDIQKFAKGEISESQVPELIAATDSFLLVLEKAVNKPINR
jgi:hypothetical protein